MVLTTQKAKQSLKRLNPKPQAHTEKSMKIRKDTPQITYLDLKSRTKQGIKFCWCVNAEQLKNWV
jgi:hypothetical protein